MVLGSTPSRMIRRAASSAIALKYSNAVYSAALAKSPTVLNKVESELNAIRRTIKSRPDVHAFVHNPTLSAKDRATGLNAIFSHAESLNAKQAMSDLTRNLMALLCENGRLGETEGVIEGFNALIAKYRGELAVVVTSATPLPKDVLSRLESTLKLSQVGQRNKSLKLTNKVNPSMLGGIILDVGDKTIDLSVASRITKFDGALNLSM